MSLFFMFGTLLILTLLVYLFYALFYAEEF
ncbi:K+-transporting ATPase, KdpF subunit [Rosenbergiella nectarea]|uniref:K+-transporting ATPase, KdpF subunit n=1 Tax=Rosenbergiella nectarea TaxID=988801 RepID=A0A1H9JSR4_9GAMM|nr:K+-transporting ATPase, KdpF subunit [Rosenbergiella nectarea]